MKVNFSLYQIKLIIDIFELYDGEFVLTDEEREILKIFNEVEK